MPCYSKTTNMLTIYQKTGLGCILASGFTFYFLNGTAYEMVAGFLLGGGIGLLFWRKKPQKFSVSTNARYKKSLRKN